MKYIIVLLLVIAFLLGFIAKELAIKKDVTPEWCGIGLCGKQIGFTSDGYVIWKE